MQCPIEHTSGARLAHHLHGNEGDNDRKKTKKKKVLRPKKINDDLDGKAQSSK